MLMNVKIVIYSRISTTDKGQDVDLQLTDLRSFVQSRGFALHKEYIDKESGAKDDREEHKGDC